MNPSMNKAEKILDAMTDLPPPPHVACKLMELLRSSRQSNDEVVQTIRYDAVLTAKLLKTCNSAFWARSEPVGSVDTAVMRLGYQEVSRIVLALSVGSSLARENKAYGVSARELWHHSVITAIASQKLVTVARSIVVEPSVAFTAGLLHDIGKMVLGRSMLPEVDKIRAQIEQNGKSWLEAETDVLGVNHAEIGACLLSRWKLPPVVVEAVANHHEPPVDQGATLSAVVHLADGCAHFVGSSYGWNSLAARMGSGVIEALGMNPDEIEKTMIHVHNESDRIKGFMAVV